MTAGKDIQDMAKVYKTIYNLYSDDPKQFISQQKIFDNCDMEKNRIQIILIMLEDKGSIKKVESNHLTYYKINHR